MSETILSDVTRTDETLPLSLDEAKDQLRQDHDDDDELIHSYICGARDLVEDQASVVLQKGTRVGYREAWPETHELLIPCYPLVTVESVKYLEDGASSLTTFDATKYRVLTQSRGRCPRIVLKNDESWPTDDLEAGLPIEVAFTCGYTAGQIPEHPKNCLRSLVTHYYENASPVISGTIVSEVPHTYVGMILQLRLWPPDV